VLFFFEVIIQTKPARTGGFSEAKRSGGCFKGKNTKYLWKTDSATGYFAPDV